MPDVRGVEELVLNRFVAWVGVGGPCNRILTWLTANAPGVWPQNTPTQWV